MYKRHGDITFYEISETEFNKMKREKVEHKGSYILSEGEVTNHKHVLTVPNIMDMDIFKTEDGGYVFQLKGEGSVVHEEHKKLTFSPNYYRVSKERELDHFSQSIERKVID
jgi:hypothetical protein